MFLFARSVRVTALGTAPFKDLGQKVSQVKLRVQIWDVLSLLMRRNLYYQGLFEPSTFCEISKFARVLNVVRTVVSVVRLSATCYWWWKSANAVLRHRVCTNRECFRVTRTVLVLTRPRSLRCSLPQGSLWSSVGRYMHLYTLYCQYTDGGGSLAICCAC